MSTLTITLWYHDDVDKWTVEINGRVHSHVSGTFVDDLAEYAVAAAKLALTNPDELHAGTRLFNLDECFDVRAS